MDSAVLGFAFFALVIGAVIGWLAASRSAAAAKEVIESLRSQLDAVSAERDASRQAVQELAALKAAQVEREKAFESRMAELREAKDALSAQFSEIGGKLLSEAQKAFLERADERFNQAGEKNEAKLKNLLQPVEATLQRYEKSLGEIEKARNASYGELKEAVAQLAQGNDQVRRETQRLANVMVSSPKARGRWGEEQLRTILESAGLAENVDFTLQSSVSDGERTLRPDCVINLPGGRCIVVDVKCPLVAFEQAYDEEDEGKRSALLLQHAGALKTYAADLGKKGYWRQFDLSPDFVIMFVPGEHFLAAAAERAPDLIETAFRNGVIVASTINMLALAKIMAGMWRQEALAAQAKEIAAIGKELHARIQTMGSHVVGLGRNLRLATDAYDDFIGSLDAKVLTQAKRFEELKVADGNKPIVEPQRIDFTPKVSAKLPASSMNDDGEPPPQIAAE
jgi:DNA recombination protein RmuC